MYAGLESQRDSVPEGQIIDIRYEDLVANPLAVLQQVYQQLDLGDFDTVRVALTTYLDGQKDYQTNRHQLEPELEQEIRRRWAPYLQRYGYE